MAKAKLTQRESAFDVFFERVRAAAAGDDELLPSFGRLRSERAHVDFVYAMSAARDLAPGDCFAEKDDALALRLMEQGDCLLDAAASAPAKGDAGLANKEAAFAKFSEAIRTAVPGGRALARAFTSRARMLATDGHHQDAARDAMSAAELWAATTPVNDSQAAADMQDALAAMGLHVSCLASVGQHAEAKNALTRATEYLHTAPLDRETKARAATALAATGSALSAKPPPKGKRNAPSRRDQDSLLPPQPDFGRNSELPAASNAICTAWAQGKGRHLVARKDIPIGTVLIAERPYAWSLSKEAMAFRCLHCCCLLRASLPCKHCSTASYCSVECRNTAWKEYHFQECRILKHLMVSKELSKMALLALRTAVSARVGMIRDAAEGPSPNKEKLIDRDDYTFNSYLEEEGRTLKKPFLSQSYSSVYGQVTNARHRSPADILKRAASAVFLARCLRHCFDEEDHERRFATGVLFHLQSCSCNAYQITEQKLEGSDLVSVEEEEIGGAVYPTVSLINHSCYPNVSRYSYGNVCVVRACRAIRKDEEILDTYGPHFLTEERDQRRLVLRTHYFFECACVACAGGWPRAVELRSVMAQFMCAHCGAALGGALSGVRACSRCRKKLDGKAAARKVEGAGQAYGAALASLAAGRLDDCLRSALSYAVFLQRLLAPPNAELARWMQLVAHCWTLFANRRLAHQALEGL